MFTRSLLLASAMLGACVGQAHAATTAPSSQPASLPAAVPQETIDKMASLLEPPGQRVPRDQLIKLLVSRTTGMMELGQKAARDYPDAGNLYEVYRLMLPAADFLARQENGQAWRQRLLDVAARMLASNAPPEAKVPADYFITRSQARPDASQPAAKDAAKLISALAARYDGGAAEASGLVYAVILAQEAELPALAQQFLDALQARHLNHEGVRAFLHKRGRHPDVGRPFVAKLTRLDGAKLALPDDLLGKVVVIDFWASWCGPCRQITPELKRIYAAYKDRGLEIVGISLDSSRADVEGFLRLEKPEWIQTYSGTADDPTAKEYGIEAIPSIWLIGRDGKVVSDDAREQLEGLVKQALSPQPAKAQN